MTIDRPSRYSAADRPSQARSRLGRYLAVAAMLVLALIAQLINPYPTGTAWPSGGVPVAFADPWPGPPGPGGGSGPSGPPGGGTEFVPPNMPAQMPDYSGNNSLPPLDQSNSVNIYNQSPNPAQQAPAQQAPIQQGGPPQHGEQPPAYDNAPGQIQQQPQPNPDQQQQPVQQQQEQQPQQQQQQEQPQQQQQENQQQEQQRDQCKGQSSIPASRPRTPKEDEIYQALRKDSPDDALTERVGRDWGLIDDAGNVTGYPKDWVVDHVIPIDRIVLIPGFVNISSYDIQKMIVELPENTFPLGPNLNKSKQNKTPKEWPGYVKRTGEAMAPEQYAKLCDQQDIAVQRIMEEISKQDIASKASPQPSTGTKPETGNIPGRQHLPQPTAPATAPPQAPTNAPTQMPTEHPSAPSTPPVLPAPQITRPSPPPFFPEELPVRPPSPAEESVLVLAGLVTGVIVVGVLAIGSLAGATN